MAWLGAPATREEPGGKLAQLRSEAKLGQADLGAIDPASETIRWPRSAFAAWPSTCCGTRPTSTRRPKTGPSFEATLEQLARLQPYFIKVWKYQAWNLTYNVSVEFDDYHDRFYYVKQGINYLKDGIKYLRDNPTLLDDLGWFFGNKVGRADEHVQYRRCSRPTTSFTTRTPPAAERDNWLVSSEWYEAGDQRGRRQGASRWEPKIPSRSSIRPRVRK